MSIGLFDVVFASTTEARERLDILLDSDPGDAGRLAILTLRWLEGMEDRQELRFIAADVSRQAIAKLESAGS